MSRPDSPDSPVTATEDGSPSSDAASTARGVGTLSRRRVFGLIGGAAALGAAAGAGGAVAVTAAVDSDSGPGGSGSGQAVAFFGPHQAGIVTPVQDRLHFAAFDLGPAATRADLVALLTAWTNAASHLTAGHDVGTGAVTGPPDSPPDDTGEALGLQAARLTLTVGFGTSLFTDATGKDRFGLARSRPARLADLPTFPGDALDPAASGGDLCVQACADDPQVAVHAIRNLARLARGTASVRYSQLGFGRTSSTSASQATARNMMGFKDGTNNIKADDPAEMNAHVWVQPGDGPDWMTGGSYLVSRRIRMLIEPWDSTPLTEQERVIGRFKGTGAPLGLRAEFDPLDLTAKGPDGEPVIDAKAHVRLAHSSHNNGAVLLRRGYSFTDGTDDLGRLEAGLFFLAYQRDPRTQFVTIQRSLAGKVNDALNEYIQHVGSGLFACPPGVQPGEYWGQRLFE
ncbi:deferrochelatase/peroxidase EfeB [Frankia sp. AgB1.9]|nr:MULTISPECIES: iron uptake transporter deferrochelatase/peroxidase subunit [unclassified Frankia]MBL7494617.1 deferrochelatase/peroxidase EfeB [Frankia sp. AgW1.1]MBL7552978.1 deferrochelatase/peroxidase EfeB [Frankia sp. AgB1.9]MBL7625181.1 deferrochelatase/peroxidase EfeB [Frankia sp. AgB1.8]